MSSQLSGSKVVAIITLSREEGSGVFVQSKAVRAIMAYTT
jgi:hypothetical protein